MQGKLNKDSHSIYEDEARLLFDYFSNAADEIIKKEDEEKKKIEKAKKNLRVMEEKERIENRNSLIRIASSSIVTLLLLLFFHHYAIGIIGLLIISILVIIHFSNKKQYSLDVKRKADELKEAEENFKNIRRSYKVTKLGIAYVPVAKKIPFGKESITLDLSGSLKDESFDLLSIKNSEVFEKDVESFKSSFESVPVVQTSSSEPLDTSEYSVSLQSVPLYDYMSKIEKESEKLKDDVKNIEKISASLTVIPPESENMEFLKACAATGVEGSPVLNVFNTAGLDSKISLLFDIYSKGEKNRNTGSAEALENLLRFIGESTETLSRVKLKSVNALLEYNASLFSNVLKSPYNNYSPRLERETIEDIKEMNFNFQDMSESYKPFKLKETSLMKFDLFSQSWIDEAGNRTNLPYSIHQIQSEIFMPVISALMEENREERVKIYERIQAQKLSYLNKWHTETQDFYGRNRDSADQLKSSIIESLSQYNASYATWKAVNDTIEKMDSTQSLVVSKDESESSSASMLISSEEMNKSFKALEEEFESYMERLEEDIERKADVFSHVTFFEAYLYASEAQKAALANANISSFDQRKLKLAKISPYLAEYGTLPPEPSVEPDAYASLDLDLEKEAESYISALRDQNGGRDGTL